MGDNWSSFHGHSDKISFEKLSIKMPNFLWNAATHYSNMSPNTGKEVKRRKERLLRPPLMEMKLN